MMRFRLPAVLCVVTLLAGGLVTSAGARTSARAAAVCGDSSVTSLGEGNYFTGIKITGAGCRTALRVAVGWQACRLKHGLRGQCHAKVDGFTCQERRPKALADKISFGGVVSCRRGSKTVGYTYQQNVR